MNIEVKTEKDKSSPAELYRGNKRRHEVLKSIKVQGREAEVDPEPTPDPDPVDPEPTPDPALVDPDTTLSGESQPSGELAPEPHVSDNEDELVTILVDGEEQQVPRSKLLDAGKRTLQKEAAADQRLATASQLLRHNEAEAERLKTYEADLLAKRMTKQTPPVEPDEAVKKNARQIIEQMLDGNEDEATEALAKVLNGRPAATPEFDPRDLVSQTTLEVREQLRKKAEAWNKFKTDYSDIANDPRLFKLADDFTLEIHAEHPEFEIGDLLSEAGKRTQQWIDDLKGVTAPEKEVDTLEARRAKKRTASMVKGAQARKEAKPEPKPMTRSDVVSNMKRRRGQRY